MAHSPMPHRQAHHAQRIRRRLDASDRLPLEIVPVTAQTADGHTWDGLAMTPRGGDRARRRVCAIVVHGTVGNYISGVPRRVAFGLAQAGYTVLTVNTRMANYGLFFGGGLLHRTPLDLDAWVALARRMGHRRIVLLGYSLGATMVTHYQALRRPEDVAGLCTLAHPLSLPGALRRRWSRFGADPDYDTIAERARAVLGDDPDDDTVDDEIFIVERALGPTTNPTDAEIYTYRTWWFSRGPEATHAVSADRLVHVDVPVALIQGGDDLIVPPSDGRELEGIARTAGVPDLRHEVVAGANHVFRGCEPEVIARCDAWLAAVIV